jgi:hypothetical protein
MNDPRAQPRWRRVCLAAIRLAAFYAAGVVVLLLLIGTLLDGPPPLRVLAYVGVPFGTFFLLAFLLLAVARRAGFAALWILLLALWVWMIRQSDLTINAPRIFLAWSALAIPLFAIGALGTSVARAGAPTLTRMSRPLLILSVWAALAALAVYATSGTMGVPSYVDADQLVYKLGRFVWPPAPFAFSAIELARVWRAMTPARSAAPAA